MGGFDPAVGYNAGQMLGSIFGYRQNAQTRKELAAAIKEYEQSAGEMDPEAYEAGILDLYGSRGFELDKQGEAAILRGRSRGSKATQRKAAEAMAGFLGPRINPDGTPVDTGSFSQVFANLPLEQQQALFQSIMGNTLQDKISRRTEGVAKEQNQRMREANLESARHNKEVEKIESEANGWRKMEAEARRNGAQQDAEVAAAHAEYYEAMAEAARAEAEGTRATTKMISGETVETPTPYRPGASVQSHQRQDYTLTDRWLPQNYRRK